MKYLFAPWRSVYAHSEDDTKRQDTSQDICVFCHYVKEYSPDTMQKDFILGAYKHSIVLLNKYPYNAGHLLIVPRAHKATLEELTPATRTEIMELASRSCSTLQKALHADGINVGLNLGTAAGAGIPSHLHIHVLPRWERDTGFMPTLADTKVISFDLTTSYKKLQSYFNPNTSNK